MLYEIIYNSNSYFCFIDTYLTTSYHITYNKDKLFLNRVLYLNQPYISTTRIITNNFTLNIQNYDKFRLSVKYLLPDITKLLSNTGLTYFSDIKENIDTIDPEMITKFKIFKVEAKLQYLKTYRRNSLIPLF